MELFYRSLFAASVYTQPKGTVSVTSLSFPCLRRAVLDLLLPRREITPEGLIRTWIGRKLHETSILGKENEIELQWEGVFGRVDEYDPETGILLEKKTTRSPPSEPREHHVTQVEYYKVLLENNGKPVSSAYIIYIDVGSAQVKVFPVELRPFEEVREEMLRKKEKVLECVKMKILPPREVGFWDMKSKRTYCSYCSYFSACFASEMMLAEVPIEEVEE